MSQYFNYDDLKGRVHTDVLTADPSCKTCSTSKCYNTYDNVQGVSLSKYTPFSSIRLGENDRTPLPAFACDTYMLSCNKPTLQNADPYNVTVKSTTKCDPLNYTNLDIEVPKMTGSLNRNKVESPRYVSHKSQRNSYNLATDVIIPNSIRDLSVEKVNLDVYNVIPFDYKTEVIVKPVKTSLSVQPRPRPMSSYTASNRNARDTSRQLSSVRSNTSVNSTRSSGPVKAVKSTSVLTKPLKSSTSSRSTSSRSASSRSTSSGSISSGSSVSTSSRSITSKPFIGSNTKSNRVPLTLPVSPKRK
jgi:hypothetical protein